jgi:hypothetical protein
MKSKFTSKVFAIKMIALLFVSSSSFLVSAPATAKAAPVSVSNSFEIGSGTRHPVPANGSVNLAVDTVEFQVPVRSEITATIQHKRTLASGIQDFTIHFELLDPSGALAASKSAVTTGATTSTTLTAPANSLPGCNPKPWKVRVRGITSELRTVSVTGTIALSFDASTLNLNIEGDLIDLNKGNEVTKTIFNIDSRCGVIALKATWDTDGIPGIDSARLTFNLRRHDGSLAKSLNANAFNALQNPKMTFSYRLTEADGEQSGNWKLEILNNSNFNTKKIKVTGTYTPGCN